MNVAFHGLVGIAIAHETGARLGAPTSPLPAGQAAGRRRTAIWAGAAALALLSHGILDGLPHYYPLGTWLDAGVSLVLLAVWLAVTKPFMRVPLLVLCLASLLPDIIDHVPRDLNRHLQLGLPEWPKLFPWHWRSGSGSLVGKTGPLWRESVTNHIIVVAFCAAAIVRTRQLFRSPHH